MPNHKVYRSLVFRGKWAFAGLRTASSLVAARRLPVWTSGAKSDAETYKKPDVALDGGEIFSDREFSSSSGGRGRVGASLLLFVGLPTLLALLYFSLLASDIYVSEAKLLVRAQDDTQTSAPALGAVFEKLGLAKGAIKSTNQDGFIALNYIKSRAVIEDIGGRPFVEKIFNDPSIDYFSRLGRDKSIEDIWDYWKKRVSPTIDTSSGVLTLRVRAYRPEDAVTVATAVIEQSENLINRISERIRQDAIRSSEQELIHAKERLGAARAKTAEFRNRTGIIDPIMVATSIGEIVSKLTIEKITLENNLASVSRFSVGDAAASRQLRSRIDSIDQKIDELNKQLAGGGGDNTISQYVKEYEGLILNEKFAEKLYAVSANMYENARNEASRKGLYLVVVVPPGKPEIALLPMPLVYTLVVFVVTFVLWSIVALILAAIQDHAEGGH